MRIYGARLQKAVKRHRHALLIAVTATLLALTGYAIWSQQVWSSYAVRYTEHRQTTIDALDQVLRLPSDTDRQRDTLLAQVKSMATQATSVQLDACKLHPLLSWQVAFDAVAAHYDSCVTAVNRIGVIGRRLAAVVAYVEDERLIIKVITVTAPQGDEGAPIDLSARAAKAWSEASAQLDALVVSKPATLLLHEAKKDTDEIASAWKDIVVANEKKDRAAYESATEKMSTAYATLDNLKSLSDQTLQQLSLDADEARRQLKAVE